MILWVDLVSRMILIKNFVMRYNRCFISPVKRFANIKKIPFENFVKFCLIVNMKINKIDENNGDVFFRISGMTSLCLLNPHSSELM